MSARHAAALVSLLLTGFASAADWPLGRYGPNRGNASPAELPARLHLHWVREYPPLKPAWPDQPKMPLNTYEPIVLGKTLFVGSAHTDSVTALDTATGAEKWRFHTDGPVRFAPVGWEGKVYFASDDGHLYCVDAARGTLVWKFRGGPADRRILGNERLISTWPARGGPVLADGVVYFAASIWPFMGIFLHALDARTGAVVWTNDGDGAVYMKQPHNADAFAGVAPQGPLVVVGDYLLVPGGRSVPALFDRKTGKMLRYQLAENGKRGGGAQVSAVGNLFINGGAAFEVASEKYLGPFPEPAVLTEEAIYNFTGAALRAHDLKNAQVETVETTDRKGEPVKTTKWTIREVAATPLPTPRIEALMKAGSRLYAGALNQVMAVDLPLSPSPQPLSPAAGARGKNGVAWSAPIEGTPTGLLAADERLFVVTREGRIYCFGAEQVKPRTWPVEARPETTADAWTRKAKTILDETGVRDGYAIAWGVGSGRLVTELARQSNLRLIVVDPDEKKVAAFRQRLVAAGLYGERVAVHAGEPLTFPFPPYLASLMVSEDPAAAKVEVNAAFLRKAFPALRPYGGVACLPAPKGAVARLVAECGGLDGAKVRDCSAGTLLVRAGALPGSANWTHEHADAANTRVSRDRLVKAPLGLLWFGGPSHEGILPRHGHGPQPQVIDGRLIIEGVDMLRAVDIYTGRLLWEAQLPGVGAFYNNLAHQPGANSSGANYISTSDGIYVAYGKSCVRLDPATGRQVAKFQLPATPGAKEAPVWGYINVHENYLIGGAEPVFDPSLGKMLTRGGDDEDPPDKKSDGGLLSKLKGINNDNLSASRRLVIMDRHSGKVLWAAEARCGFRHNGVCVGGGRLYAIDRYSGAETARIRRRGEEPKFPPRLLVFDLRSGKLLWSTEEDVFGTWLSYSAEHDILVEAGRVARDVVLDEPRGMRAYRGGDGKVLWYEEDYLGPAMLHHDTILMAGSACSLLSGAPKMRQDPITGRPVAWTWLRNYGCNTPAASEHLLTFRSGAAGFFDYCNDGGTGNLGGFRSGCTNNLIVAGGLLNVPDYTRTCTCSYQNQCSLALVHMPEAELWTFFGPGDAKHPVRRVGINLGAPGDRKADDGTLWLAYPVTTGKSPTVGVQVSPAKLEWFRRHSSQVQGDGPSWVAASGAKGIRALTIDLNRPSGPECSYTVRLVFLEPDRLQPGQRVFSVALQGQPVLRDFDIVKEAGGPLRSLVKEFRGIKATKALRLTLTASTGEPVLCGVEIVAE